jgi:hypothetical protein
MKWSGKICVRYETVRNSLYKLVQSCITFVQNLYELVQVHMSSYKLVQLIFCTSSCTISDNFAQTCMSSYEFIQIHAKVTQVRASLYELVRLLHQLLY